jgi:hypothetical protein
MCHRNLVALAVDYFLSLSRHLQDQVRVQHQRDRMQDLNTGGFLDHGNYMEKDDETEIRNPDVTQSDFSPSTLKKENPPSH